ATPRSRSDFSGGSAWESNPKPLNKRNQATTHANSSFRPSEQRVDRRLDLFARPRHYPQMRLSFGDSLETSFDDDPKGAAGSVGYGDVICAAHEALPDMFHETRYSGVHQRLASFTKAAALPFRASSASAASSIISRSGMACLSRARGNEGVFPKGCVGTRAAAIHRSLGVGFTVEVADCVFLSENQALQIWRGADHRVNFARIGILRDVHALRHGHREVHEHFGSVVDELVRVIAGRKQDEIPGTDLRQSRGRAHFRRSGDDQECLFGHVVLVKWVRFLSRRELPHTARDRLARQLLASLEIGALLHPFTPRNI